MGYVPMNLPNGTVLTADHVKHMEQGIVQADCEIRRIVNEDTEKRIVLRDLESGTYVLYGYVEPFPNSNITMICSNVLVHVTRKTAGSHILCMSPLNATLDFIEILVDESNENGFTYSSTDINLLEFGRIKRTVYLTAQSAEYEQVPCHITSATGDMTIEEINAQSTNGVTGWAETPVNVSADAKFCYAATAYFENGVWGNFSRSVQIGRYIAPEE